MLAGSHIMPDEYFVVAAVTDLTEGGQMHVDVNAEEILLCLHEGHYYAIAYFCSHEEFALEGGSMCEGCITCPYHGAEFLLKDGAVVASPAYEPIKTWQVEVKDGSIAIRFEPDPE